MKKQLLFLFCLFSVTARLSAQGPSMQAGIGLTMSVDGIRAGVSFAPAEYLHAGLEAGYNVRQTLSVYNYPIYGNAFLLAPYLSYIYPADSRLRPYLQGQFFSFSGSFDEKLSPDRVVTHSLAGKEMQLLAGVEYFFGRNAGIYIQTRFYSVRFSDGDPIFQIGIPSLGAEWFF